MKIELVKLDGVHEIQPDAIPDMVHRGEVLIIREGLQEIGWFQPLVDISLTELRAVVGPEIAAKVAAEGFANLHEHLTVEQLFDFNERTMAKLKVSAPHMLKSVSEKLLNSKGTYLEQVPNARTFVPFDVVSKNKAAFRKIHERRGPGKVTEHGPHHDSWFEHPLNTINVWSAITPVLDGNGMVVFPEVFGSRLPYDKSGAIRKDQFYGRPFNFELGAGDIVLFSGEHLHGSEINRTDRTRYVISMRMTIKPPKFHGSSYAYPYLASGMVGTALERFADLPIKLQPDYAVAAARKLRSRVKQALGKETAHSYLGASDTRNIPPLDDLSGNFPDPLQIVEGEDGRRSFAADALAVGEVRVIDARTCAGKLPDGSIVAYSRFCPHEGADLAAGHIRSDSRIMCPWHNLTFDPATGASPCESLAKLRTRTLEIRDGRVLLPEVEAVS